MSLNSLGNRGRRVPTFIRGPLIIVALGLPIYWWVDESGLYYYFREVQVELTGGSFIPMLTVMLCMIVSLLPVLVIVHLLAGFFPEKKPKNLLEE